MKVRLAIVLCFLMFAAISARNVKSKPGTFEDTYGEETDGEVQNDDYDDGDYGGSDTDEPSEATEDNNDTRNEIMTAQFQSKAQEVDAKIGDNVKLPCEVTNSDIILLWKRNETELLFQGDIAVHPVPNIKRTEQGLEVVVESENDFGRYSCQMMISSNNSPKIVHTIRKLGPPTIHSIYTADNRTEYNIGDKLILTCNASGNPPPKIISWAREAETLEPKGKTLTIESLKARHSGMYRCLADNKIERPAHSHIEINVRHKPEVSIDKYIVNSDHQKDAELICTVRAYPSAIINWQKNGVNIVADASKITLKKHKNNMEYNLLITNLTEEDFGQYTCTAKNILGKTERNVTLVKIPAIQGSIESEKKNREVVLTWKVESKSPIIEHQLQYRKKGEEVWKNLTPNVTPNVNDTYTVKYSLTGLGQGTFEVRTRSKNAHGWSEFSETIDFEGVAAKHDPHHKPHKKHKDKEPKEKSVAFSSQASPPAWRQQDKEPATQAKSVPSTTQATPAQHQENDPTAKASEVGAGSSVTSSICLTSIALLLLCFRQ